MDDANLKEVKASGKSLEDCLDDLILEEKAHPHPNPLNVIWLIRVAFGIGLSEAKLLTGCRCSELDQGLPRSPERIRELRASLGA